MKSIRQMLRRPTGLLLGILLIALSVAVLCVCLGQSFAAGVAMDGLDERFLTIAFPSELYGAEADAWMMAYGEQNESVIRAVSAPGLISAYVSELNPDNFTDYLHYGNYEGHAFAPYDRAVLEIVLDAFTSEKDEEGLCLTLIGRVASVVALQKGYSDPTDFTVRMTMRVANEETLAALNLQAGERYLVYGTEYTDHDYLLRNMMSQTKRMELFDAFDHSKYDDFYRRGQYTAKVRYGPLITGITASQKEMYRTVSMTLTDPAELLTQGGETITFTNLDGTAVTCSREEYRERYGTPAIVCLGQNVENFLASPEGAEWRTLLSDFAISNKTFPVVGVDALEYLTHFARGKAEIVAGEDFSKEELASGEKVCMISETLAMVNGISVGDRVTLSFYRKDLGHPAALSLSDGEGVTNPSAAPYCSATTSLCEGEEYTVVGLYRKADEWSLPVMDLYGFTPNTVFVPKNSVSIPMEYGCGGLFRTFVLENGSLEELAVRFSEAGFDEQLLFDDNGYSNVQSGLDDYENVADRILPLGIIVWAVVQTLFLLIYPTRLGKELDTMDSLGSTRGQRIGHVLLSSLTVLVPGSLAGLGLGFLLWESVVSMLTGSAGNTLGIRMDPVHFVLTASLQLLPTVIAVLILAFPLTRTRGLDKRR